MNTISPLNTGGGTATAGSNATATAAVDATSKAAPRRRLIGLESAGPRVPRQGQKLVHSGREVGEVCSGAPSPTLGLNIASAYVELGLDRPGQELEVDFKGKRQPCTVRELPFFSRTRK